MDWDLYRRDDGSIDLYKAWAAHPHAFDSYVKAERFFSFIEMMQPINSRQAAAIAIATFQQFEMPG